MKILKLIIRIIKKCLIQIATEYFAFFSRKDQSYRTYTSTLGPYNKSIGGKFTSTKRSYSSSSKKTSKSSRTSPGLSKSRNSVVMEGQLKVRPLYPRHLDGSAIFQSVRIPDPKSLHCIKSVLKWLWTRIYSPWNVINFIINTKDEQGQYVNIGGDFMRLTLAKEIEALSKGVHQLVMRREEIYGSNDLHDSGYYFVFTYSSYTKGLLQVCREDNRIVHKTPGLSKSTIYRRKRDALLSMKSTKSTSKK